MSRKKATYSLESLINGDEREIELIYQQIFPKVLRYVLLNNGQRADAEDVFHDALLQLVARSKVQKFEIKSSFEAYLYTACKNLWRRALNNSKKRVIKDDIIELPSREEEDMSYAVLEQELWEFYNEKFRELSESCRKVLELRIIQDLPYDEIMERLSYASENVVWQRVFRCLSKLRALIQSDPRYKNLKSL